MASDLPYPARRRNDIQVASDSHGLRANKFWYNHFGRETLQREEAESSDHPPPHRKGLGFLYGTKIFGAANEPDCQSCNVCTCAEGEVDRSPIGTGVRAGPREP